MTAYRTKSYLLVALALVASMGLSACHRGSRPDDGSSETKKEYPSQFELHLYRYQNDIRNVFPQLIRYSDTEEAYILDLTPEDAESIGISDEDYQCALEVVETLNRPKTDD